MEIPPRPPCVQIQPLVEVENQQNCVASPQPLKHKLVLPHALPVDPQILQFEATLIVRLEYPAALPGMPPPQQHILAPEPPAPHDSIVA